MAKSMCGRCGVRWAQFFSPPMCAGCKNGVGAVAREVEDESAAAIERRYRAALAEIKARDRQARSCPQPSA